MQAILDILGLNWASFLWHLVNFLVLLVLLYLVLYKPVTRMLDERATRVRQSMEDAERARRQAEQAEADRQALLAETRSEAAQIRQSAEEQSRRILADAEQLARQSEARILAQAEASARALHDQALATVQRQVAELVVTAVERVTRGALDGQSQRTLVQQFLASEPNGSVSASGRAPDSGPPPAG
jgi:F-type H+-transporting ATPase subunit b